MSEKTALALGNFDGLHLGHMAVLDSAMSFAGDGMTPCAVLFDIHTQSATKGIAPPALMLPRTRDEMLKKIGMRIIRIPFSQVMTMSAEQFVRDILFDRLGAGAVCCGFNYRFGAGARAGAKQLVQCCDKLGIDTRVCGEVICGGEAISSTRIRELIAGGNMSQANAMLGREFSYTLPVVGGYRVGRTLGAPTINQIFPDGFIVPRFGVYASRVVVDERQYLSVTNIGIRPTITDNTLLSETHIFDFSGDLYGRDIEVFLRGFIRDETKFACLDELKVQIKKDAAVAYAYK